MLLLACILVDFVRLVVLEKVRPVHTQDGLTALALLAELAEVEHSSGLAELAEHSPEEEDSPELGAEHILEVQHSLELGGHSPEEAELGEAEHSLELEHSPGLEAENSPRPVEHSPE